MVIIMSRIGKKPIPIPASVKVQIMDRRISVEGPKGSLSRLLPPEVGVTAGDREIIVAPSGGSSRRTPAFWGLARTLVANMIEGVSTGFEKHLEFEGIGFRAAAEGNALVMQLGFSHPVRYALEEGVSVRVEKNTIVVSGADKEKVGHTAAAIRALKPPEPYKGKGIRYQGEVIRRKAGKKAVASA
jgi:large subunit ribosomal protein L6